MLGIIIPVCVMALNHIFTVIWFNRRISVIEEKLKRGDE